MTAPRHRNWSIAALGFGALALATLVGFWPSYLTQLTKAPSVWTHLHAAGVAAWLALLIAQPLLLAGGQRAAHRSLGRIAFGLVPWVVVTSLVLAVLMTRPRDAAGIEAFRYELFFVQLATTALFAACAGLAIAWRHEPALHARLMMASGLSFIDPVFARVFAHFTPERPLLVSHGSIVLGLLAYVALAVADRRAPRGARVFAVAAAAYAALQGVAQVIGGWPPWQRLMQACLT